MRDQTGKRLRSPWRLPEDVLSGARGFLTADSVRSCACWRSQSTVEVFGTDGRYLGEVEFPRGHGPLVAAFVRDDMILLPGQDDAGAIMVKRYRLVLPGER